MKDVPVFNTPSRLPFTSPSFYNSVGQESLRTLSNHDFHLKPEDYTHDTTRGHVNQFFGISGANPLLSQSRSMFDSYNYTTPDTSLSSPGFPSLSRQGDNGQSSRNATKQEPQEPIKCEESCERKDSSIIGSWGIHDPSHELHFHSGFVHDDPQI